MFVVNVPVGILALLLAARHLPIARGQRARGFDPPGQALGIAALSLVTLGLIEGGAAGWGSPAALVPLAAFIPAAVAFVFVEARACRPMLPLSLFRSHTFSARELRRARDQPRLLRAAVRDRLLLPARSRLLRAARPAWRCCRRALFVAIASALSGRVTGRIGPRVPMLVGLTLGAAGFAGLIAAGRATSYALLVPALIAAGFGMAMTMPAATAAVIESAPAERAGIASGVLNAARQAGGAVGVALLGTLIAGSSLVSGLHVAMASSACAFALAAAVTAVAVRPGR